jgi:hypothetical protein
LSWYDNFSLLFDGVDEYVNTDDVLTSLANTTVGTWSVWAKPVDATPLTTQGIISFGDTSLNTAIQLRNKTSGKLSCVARNNTNIRWSLETDAVAFSDGVWTHVAVTQAGGGGDPVLYVNGVAVAQTFLTSTEKTAWFNSASMSGMDNGRIGMLDRNGVGGEFYYNGNIDEPIFINRALTAPQVLDIVNGGAPKDESGIANGVSYFRMGDGCDNYNDDVANEWSLKDNIGSNDVQSVNMELADREIDTP